MKWHRFITYISVVTLLVVLALVTTILYFSLDSTINPIPSNQLTATSTPVLKPYVVALQPISRGQTFGEGVIGLQPLKRDNVPLGALTHLDETINRVARIDIEPGQVIHQDLLLVYKRDIGTDYYEEDTCTAPTYQGVVVCFSAGEQYLYGADLIGREIWRTVASRTLASTLIGAEDRLYFWRSNDRLYALNANTGQEIWSFQSLEVIDDLTLSKPLLIENRLLFWRPSSQSLCALETKTGQEKWCFNSEGFVSELGLVAPNKLSVVSSNGYRYLIDFQTGQEIFREPFGN